MWLLQVQLAYDGGYTTVSSNFLEYLDKYWFITTTGTAPAGSNWWRSQPSGTTRLVEQFNRSQTNYS